jgi:hypothetical protein
MKRVGIILTATAGLAGLAQAADLPTTKAVVEQTAPKPNCSASFRDWLNSSASDCPLTYAGITLYGTVDVGAGYFSQGSVAAGWDEGRMDIVYSDDRHNVTSVFGGGL